MISDGVLTLHRAGALDPDHPVTSSFLIGSPELYGWADRNDGLQMRRTETVNDPSRIAEQRAMLSVNAAMQVDLFAQANASFVDNRIHSGFGGQPDFVTGALHSSGGHAIVALHAWHHKTDTSTVVPILDNPVTSFQHSAIVSEHGCAELFGRSQHAAGSTDRRSGGRPPGSPGACRGGGTSRPASRLRISIPMNPRHARP